MEFNNARHLVETIANDYVELSHEKILWQRNDFMNQSRKYLELNKTERVYIVYECYYDGAEVWRSVDKVFGAKYLAELYTENKSKEFIDSDSEWFEISEEKVL